MAPIRPSKRRKVDSHKAASDTSLFSGTDARVLSSANWDSEQAYEQLPRKIHTTENARLPIKDQEGWKHQEVTVVSEEESDSAADTSKFDEDAELDHGHEEPAVPETSQREQILKAKEELARLAGLINEEPEEHIGSLKTLAQIGKSSIHVVKQLALATQCAVYKDIIPGYRIRPLQEDALKEKVSKDVKKLRNYEQSLVSGYQAYVRDLDAVTKTARNANTVEDEALAATALSCASTLLLAVPHFNFRGDLLRIVIAPLSRSRPNKKYEKSIQTLETLFEDDEDGRPSLDAVTSITKMIKAKDYRVNESVLNLFLSLRLLSEFSTKGSYDRVDRNGEETVRTGKKLRAKKEFRTKREKKMVRERKVLEKEMQEADAAVSYEERDRLQADMLKMVFATYFRILKARTPHLMGAVLEGLARYAHLINQDFFGDILEALKELIAKTESKAQVVEEGEEPLEDAESRSDGNREALLCIVTAFALLQGQDGSAAASTLHLDLSFFITYLYRILHASTLDANIELDSKSLHLPDPHDSSEQKRPNVNAKTTIVLLIRSLSSVLIPRTALRSVPPLRLAAFTKQLMTAALQLPEKSSIAMLGLLAQTTKAHGRKVSALWNTEERKGDGVFDALTGDVERSNPLASTIWEGEILRRHYSPKVKEALKNVERNVREV